MMTSTQSGMCQTPRFSVRHLLPGELALARQLIGVFRRAFEEVDGVFPTDDHLRFLLARDDFHAVVALTQGEAIGGFCAHELPMFGSSKRELLIYDLAVAPEYQRCGTGRALIEFARNLCRSRNLSAMSVPAHADDGHAVAFYAATGLKREEVAWFVEEFETL